MGEMWINVTRVPLNPDMRLSVRFRCLFEYVHAATGHGDRHGPCCVLTRGGRGYSGRSLLRESERPRKRGSFQSCVFRDLLQWVKILIRSQQPALTFDP